MSRYKKMFKQLDRRQEGAFIPFVMLGDPDANSCLQIVDALIVGGADALELGFPFSDPVSDGPVIQRAAMRAFAAHINRQGCLQILQKIREKYPDIPIGLLIYANLVVYQGISAFYKSVAEVGVDSVLIVDVPTYEAAPFVKAALIHGIDPVLIVPPNASDERLKEIAALSKGYTYVVTRSGVTGADANLKLSAKELLLQLKKYGASPAIFGFGISKPEHVKLAINEGAAGAISGSAIVDFIENSLGDQEKTCADILDFVKQMKAASKV
jgi:tryptophan synthase alpha chain